MTDQRRYPRTPSEALVEMHHPAIGGFEARARDLSEGGIFVLAGNYVMPPIGTVLQVRIKRHSGVINQEPVPMRVVHHQFDGMGLAFS
jgi:hypothetical protein